MKCTFCKIICREIESQIVFEDAVSLSFLDHRPLFPGHSLLVPKDHYETLNDLPAELIEPLFSNARLMAGAIEQAMEAEGTFVAINNRISQSVPHLHIHIVPRRKKDGLKGFFWPRNPYKDEAALLKTQKAIQKEVALIQKVSAPEVWIGIASRLRASQVLGRDRASPRGSAMKTQNRGSYYAETRGT